MDSVYLNCLVRYAVSTTVGARRSLTVVMGPRSAADRQRRPAAAPPTNEIVEATQWIQWIVRLNRLNRLELMSPTRLAPDMLDADKSSLETGSFQRCFHEQANN